MSQLYLNTRFTKVLNSLIKSDQKNIGYKAAQRDLSHPILVLSTLAELRAECRDLKNQISKKKSEFKNYKTN